MVPPRSLLDPPRLPGSRSLLGLRVRLGMWAPWLALLAAVAAALAPSRTTPLPLLLLAMACFALRQPSGNARFSLLFGAGLLACGVGDLLLDGHFKAGLVAMGGGQALMALALLCDAMRQGQQGQGPGRDDRPGARAKALLPAIGPAWIAAVEVPRLPLSLGLIASAYCCASAALVALACRRALRERDRGSLGLAAGALLFVTSDALVALDHYLLPFPGAAAGIAGTYAAAQVLLASYGVPAGGSPARDRLRAVMPAQP